MLRPVRPAFELALPTVQLLHKARIRLDEGPSLSRSKGSHPAVDPAVSWEHQRIILGYLFLGRSWHMDGVFWQSYMASWKNP